MVGHEKDEPVARAIAELREQCLFLTVLGSYPEA
jgi:prephenate dehydratase